MCRGKKVALVSCILTVSDSVSKKIGHSVIKKKQPLVNGIPYGSCNDRKSKERAHLSGQTSWDET